MRTGKQIKEQEKNLSKRKEGAASEKEEMSKRSGCERKRWLRRHSFKSKQRKQTRHRVMEVVTDLVIICLSICFRNGKKQKVLEKKWVSEIKERYMANRKSKS